MARRRHRPAVRVIPYGEQAFPTDGSLALKAGPPPAPVPPPGVLMAVGARDLAPDRDVRTAADGTVRLVAEVLAGARPVRQLARRATAEVCQELAPHVRPVSAGARVSPPRVLASWVQEPAPGSAEAGAVVTVAGEVRALAMRLELHRGRWRCTVLETTGPPCRTRAGSPGC